MHLTPATPNHLHTLQAFDAHLRGFRHQRRIKQAQLLQQGQEVSAMLQGMLLDEAPRAAAAGAVGMQAAGMPGSALPAVAIRRPDLALEDDGELLCCTCATPVPHLCVPPF